MAAIKAVTAYRMASSIAPAGNAAASSIGIAAQPSAGVHAISGGMGMQMGSGASTFYGLSLVA